MLPDASRWYPTLPDTQSPKAALDKEWTTALDDLEDMGFDDRNANRKALLAHDGLVKRAVKDARERGWKVTPLCSYAAVQFRRHEEWQDLLA